MDYVFQLANISQEFLFSGYGGQKVKEVGFDCEHIRICYLLHIPRETTRKRSFGIGKEDRLLKVRREVAEMGGEASLYQFLAGGFDKIEAIAQVEDGFVTCASYAVYLQAFLF